MSFEIALSGLTAINDQLETISHNIANTGTYGFKSSRSNFASMYAGIQPSGVEVGSITQSIGIGGSAQTTGRNMDAMIQGRGFFITRDTSGQPAYTRVGIFGTDKDGYVVDSFGHRAQGYAQLYDAAGQPLTGAALGPLGDLKLRDGQISAQPTTDLKYVGNLSSDWTVPTGAFDPTNPLTYNSSSTSVVFDSLGSKHTLTQYFVKTGTGAVTVNYSFDGTALAPTTAMTFNSLGQLTAPAAPVALAIAAPAGADPLSIDVDYTGTTGFGGSTTELTNAANGYASGVLTGVQIDDDGSVLGVYSNGLKQRAGTLALATFSNEDGLVPISDTAWAASSSSGDPLYSTPGTGLSGTLKSGALEQSNVDMSAQLVMLMTAQRNYQANTKVISTNSAMMQSLMQAV
ncbi:flagellar hook-basal body complex protein [Ramlibacter sp. H39-3-26]|uniref:flagellar hook-basal body complex protein n=1 Tax=Curvibacter soli TaxID=3031331 RepID=UPI0023D9FD66|nr:flagellar hook-basal body complex protein [Ramlibacter sp. H39-3-26]MDF1484200.1 flagellar hook-basal body complex protein [Ramlibacter sp. H39-3-26]